MFAIAVQYLTGVVSAKRVDNRDECEWPPHPDRLFMALTAGSSEADDDALRWLEQQDPPAMVVSDASFRTTRTSFVPVNDIRVSTASSSVQKSLSLLPEFSRFRNRPRSFVACVPEDDTVHFVWENAVPAEQQAARLEQLCRRVCYLGHSSSLVRMWVASIPPVPNLRPTQGTASLRMRVPYPGRVDELRRRFDLGERPAIGAWVGYRSGKPEPLPMCPRGEFVDMLPLQLSPRGIAITQCYQLARSIRRLMIATCPEPMPEWISGHKLDGSVTRAPHVAIVPLPFVDHVHADGRVIGAAFLVPADVSSDEQARCLGRLLLDEHGRPIERRVTGRISVGLSQSGARALDPRTWMGPSPVWATATPIAMHRWSKSGAESLLVEACQHAGFPEPAQVTLTAVSPLVGVPHARAFPRGTHRRRFMTHAIVRWAGSVSGPMVLGAERYLGYGLMKPWRPVG